MAESREKDISLVTPEGKTNASVDNASGTKVHKKRAYQKMPESQSISDTAPEPSTSEHHEKIPPESQTLLEVEESPPPLSGGDGAVHEEPPPPLDGGDGAEDDAIAFQDLEAHILAEAMQI